MILYDAHTHSTFISENNRGKRHKGFFSKVSVDNIIAESRESAIVLEQQKFYSIGIHPWYLPNWELRMEQVQRLSLKKEVVAIGECGLDYSISIEKSFQKEIFIRQIEWSEKIAKPMIIHAVCSYSDVLNIRRQRVVKQKWLFHAFNSSWQIAKQLLKNKGYFSFGKMILKDSIKRIELIQKLPINRILIETDEDEDCIFKVYQKISEIRKIEIAELISIQKDNFKEFYKI